GDTNLLHKYAEEVPVSMHIEMGGTTDQRLLVLLMTRRGPIIPTMVFDHHGRVLFANQAVCSLLGTKPKDMRGRDIATLLPEPFGFLHHRWIKEAGVAITRPPPASCRAGISHALVSSNGVHVPVRMKITGREIGGVHMNIVRATRIPNEEALDERRLSITIDQHGHIVGIAATTPHHGMHLTSTCGLPPASTMQLLDGTHPKAGDKPPVFGFDPVNLLHRKVYEVVDIFAEWHGQGHSVMHAVKALAQHSSSRPGSAWRVGVMPHHLSAEAEKAAHKLGRELLAGGPPPEAEAEAKGDHLATNRTVESARATARDVELDFGDTPRPDGAKPATPTVTTATPAADAIAAKGNTGGRSALSAMDSKGSRVISDDSAMARGPTGAAGGGAEGGKEERLTRRMGTHEWQDVVHVDPEQVPIPHDAEYDIDHHYGDEKDMTVSSGESSHDDDGSGSGAGSERGDQQAGRNTDGAAEKMTRAEALQRKKTMAALDPEERVQYVRAVRRVKEWLASGYYFDQRDAEPIGAVDASSHGPHAAPAHGRDHEHADAPHAHGHADGLRDGRLSRVAEEPDPIKGPQGRPHEDGSAHGTARGGGGDE
ncbi:hypothetical protein TSOC_013962, partial [Tetrabaena socialis]